jgi:DNA polymerase (family 10)
MEENRQIAAWLEEAADLLHAQGANPFRADAYRKAADTIAQLDKPLRPLFDARGTQALEALPSIGGGIAGAIAEMLITGRWSQLEQLRADAEGEAPSRGEPEPPAVATLLELDAEYRDKARAGTLPKIAPKRFNPEGVAWLPVLHSRHGGRHFTVLYSNTARAHELGRTHDWVVIYFHDGDHAEGQHTVVTERRGALAGKRVVRGREPECRRHYRASPERNPGLRSQLPHHPH